MHVVVKLENLRRVLDLTAMGFNLAGHCQRRRFEVNDSLFRHPNRGKSGSMRLVLPYLLGVEQLQVLESIGRASLEKCVEAGDFLGLGGNNEFAAYLVLDVMAFANSTVRPIPCTASFAFCDPGL